VYIYDIKNTVLIRSSYYFTLISRAYNRQGAVKLNFDLHFTGEHGNLKFDIPSILKKNAARTEGRDYLALFVKNFLVGLQDKGFIRPTSTLAPAREGTLCATDSFNIQTIWSNNIHQIADRFWSHMQKMHFLTIYYNDINLSWRIINVGQAWHSLTSNQTIQSAYNLWPLIL